MLEVNFFIDSLLVVTLLCPRFLVLVFVILDIRIYLTQIKTNKVVKFILEIKIISLWEFKLKNLTSLIHSEHFGTPPTLFQRYISRIFMVFAM